MADRDDARRSYPYMPVSSWQAVRARLKQKAPRVIDADWVASVLGVSEKAAKNTVAQLRAMGLMDADGLPEHTLIDDLRDDSTYAHACQRIADTVYPQGLRDAFDSSQEDIDPVASWFMRNARTSATTAKVQGRFYLALIKSDLSATDEAAPAPRRRAQPRSASAGNGSALPSATPLQGQTTSVSTEARAGSAQSSNGGRAKPDLHIDLQIHISSDAGKEQIDAIFASMAKHLYGSQP